MLGKFHHPGYPQTYPINIFCYYQIVVPKGHIIELKMKYKMYGGLACSVLLTFFDGAGVSNKKIGRYVMRKIISSLIIYKFSVSYCGGGLRDVLNSTENALTFIFESDSYYYDDAFWMATYRAM